MINDNTKSIESVKETPEAMRRLEATVVELKDTVKELGRRLQLVTRPVPTGLAGAQGPSGDIPLEAPMTSFLETMRVELRVVNSILGDHLDTLSI